MPNPSIEATATSLPRTTKSKLRQDIYASAAIAGIVVYLLLRAAKASTGAAFAAGFVTVAATRLAAIALDLRLPVFSLPP
jgi:uncharacterized membrane protein YeiH